MPENRRFSRVGFNVNCTFITGNREISCRVLNLSLKGLLAEIDGNYTRDDLKSGIIEIKLLNSDIKISFESELAHLQDGLVGFRFLTTDCDSITHLRSILEANTGNPDKIDSELHSMIESEKKD
jgi:hypothetical protein